MAMKSYKLYGTISTAVTSSAVAQITFPRAGTIRSLRIESKVQGAVVDNDMWGVAVSFNSGAQFDVNDISGELISQVGNAEFTTSGMMTTAASSVVPGLNFRVQAGDRLYLHMTQATARNLYAYCHIYVDE